MLMFFDSQLHKYYLAMVYKVQRECGALNVYVKEW